MVINRHKYTLNSKFLSFKPYFSWKDENDNVAVTYSLNTLGMSGVGDADVEVEDNELAGERLIALILMGYYKIQSENALAEQWV